MNSVKPFLSIDFLNHNLLMLTHCMHPNSAKGKLPQAIEQGEFADGADERNSSYGGEDQGDPGVVGAAIKTAEGFTEGKVAKC